MLRRRRDGGASCPSRGDRLAATPSAHFSGLSGGSSPVPSGREGGLELAQVARGPVTDIGHYSPLLPRFVRLPSAVVHLVG